MADAVSTNPSEGRASPEATDPALRDALGPPDPAPSPLPPSTRPAPSEPRRFSPGATGARPAEPIATPRPPVSDVAIRPAPALPRAAIPHTGRDVGPAAPRYVSPQEGRRQQGPGGEPDPSSLAPVHAPAHLSPRMTAIFGGLFGLATVTSIIALLIQVVPPRDERAIVASIGAPPSEPEAAVNAVAAREAKKPKRTPLPSPWRLSELAKDPSVILASATMDRRSFVEALAEKGVPKAQSYRIMKAFEDVRKFDKNGRKDRFSVAMDRSTRRVKAFEFEVSPSEIYQAREGTDGLLVGSRLDLKIADNEVVSAFYVGADRVESYQAAGLEDGILAAIDEAFNGRLSTESFEEGATVRFIATEETALGLFSRYKGFVAIEYRPPDPAAKPTRIYAFKGEQSRGYFDERGRQPYAGGWRSPVPGAPVTSRFNPKRMHPILKKPMPHNGTDFGADMGTPVYAAYRGTVDMVGPAGASGNLVTVNHPGGVQTGYAHLSRFAPGIKHGDVVGTHQLVGYIGSTGRSTGPHLHFSAKKDGKFFDAETLQLDGERVMPAIDRPAFLAFKADLDRRLDAIPLPEPPPEKPKPALAAGAGADPALAESGAPAAGSAIPAASAGIHPSAMIEDSSEDDGDGDEVIGAPALGGPPPRDPGSSPPAGTGSAPVRPGAPPPDPAEAEEEGEGEND